MIGFAPCKNDSCENHDKRYKFNCSYRIRNNHNEPWLPKFLSPLKCKKYTWHNKSLKATSLSARESEQKANGREAP